MATKCIVNKATLTDIANAIREKDGSTDTILPSQMAQKISDIPSGGGLVEMNDVNFYRPDGTLLFSYAADEVLADGWTMPEQPEWTITWDTYTGVHDIQMTPQGWNYDLTHLQEKVQNYGKCDVGAMYKPTDNKTHIRLVIPDDILLEQPLHFAQSVSDGVLVDWGDGSEPQTYSGTAEATRYHTYPSKGTYDITLEAVSGILKLMGATYPTNGSISGTAASDATSPARAYSSRIRHVILAPNVSIGINTFVFSNDLSSVVIPQGVTSIGTSAFQYCYSIGFIVLPLGITSIGNYAFQNCNALDRVVLPQVVTSIGTNVFQKCYALKSCPIPSGVTSIGNYAFDTCSAIPSVVIPPGVTSIGNYAFQYGQSVTSVVIPPGVTSIGNYAFYYCQAITSVVFPQGITSIGSSAFQTCYGVQVFDFTRADSVPKIANVSAFGLISNTAKIVVPDDLYDGWVSATNWSDASIVTHIVKVSEYFGG